MKIFTFLTIRILTLNSVSSREEYVCFLRVYFTTANSPSDLPITNNVFILCEFISIRFFLVWYHRFSIIVDIIFYIVIDIAVSPLLWQDCPVECMMGTAVSLLRSTWAATHLAVMYSFPALSVIFTIWFGSFGHFSRI